MKYSNIEAKKDFFTIDPENRVMSFSSKDALIIADKRDSQIKFDQLLEYSNKNQVKFLATDYGTHGYKILCYDNVVDEIIKFILN
ncbi:MAG: hypothetical protein PF488_03635 [Patescibacteria group bacterium]|nr:hypothetical protein [Patescibacteria group bacterium]